MTTFCQFTAECVSERISIKNWSVFHAVIYEVMEFSELLLWTTLCVCYKPMVTVS